MEETDIPTSPGTDSFFDGVSTYSLLVFNALVKPQLTSRTGRSDSSLLLQNNVRSWNFPFPAPHSLSRKHLTPDKEDNIPWSNEAFALSDAVLVVVDYEHFFPEFWAGFNCPCCQKKLQRRGYCNYVRAARGFDITRCFVAVEYRCEGCLSPSAGKKSSSYTTLSKELIAQLDPVVRNKLDFVVGEAGYIMSKPCLTQAASMMMHGLAVAAIEKISLESLQTLLATKERSRLSALEHYVKHPRVGFQPRVTEKTSMVELVGVFALTSPIIEKAFNLEQARVGPYQQASFPSAALGHSQLSGDMNFPWGNATGPSGAVGLYHIMNPHGEVVCGQGLTTRSPEELVPTFEKIRKYKQDKNILNFSLIIADVLFTLFTFTRIAYLAICVELLIFILFSIEITSIKNIIKNITTCIVALGIGIYFYLNYLNEIINIFFLQRGDTQNDRFMQFPIAIKAFFSTPILGTGHGQYNDYIMSRLGTADNLVIHSQLLNMIVEEGLINFILFAAFNIFLISMLIKKYRKKMELLFILMLFIGNLICINFNPNQTYEINIYIYYFILFGLLFASDEIKT